MAMRRLENSYRLLARLVGQQQAALASTQAQQHGGGEEREQKGGRQGGWAAAGLGLGLVGLSAPLLADEKKEKTVFGKTKADRVRQFATADNVFDHFASYQVVSDRGQKTTMMSTRNFYNAMTPGSHLGEEVMFGKSSYKQIAPAELNSKYVREANKMPVAREGWKEGSLLNAINEHGLLSYTDFHFLLLLMSTPVRYLEFIFHGFDVSADGYVEAKEFVHVLARIANAKIDPDQLMKEGATSGLVRYLFGDDLSGSLRKEDFVKLQSDLIDDVLEMEFTRYVATTKEKMSETDFCRHLLYSSSISQKRKEKMIKLVEAEFKGKSNGISFESFKTFYNVLFGGADLERAMFFLDSANLGVTRDEFSKVANWVVGTQVDPHVIEVVYCLLDEDGDRNLSTKEFNPVLFSWRHSRGFQNGALSVTLGNMKF